MLSSFSCVQLCATLWTIAYQAPLSMGSSRQECWSLLPCYSPGDLPNLEIEPESLMSPASVGRFFTTSATWKAQTLASVQFSHSVVSDSETPWTVAHQAFWSITNSQSLLKLMSIESVRPSNHLILCHRRLLPPSIFPSIRVFSSESVFHIGWPKDWSFSFSISPSNEYSELISLRVEWFVLLAVQGTLKSLLQNHSSKASILWHSSYYTSTDSSTANLNFGQILHFSKILYFIYVF